MLLIKANYTWRNIKQHYKNNKLKIIAPKWNDEFKLPDGSYSGSDIILYRVYHKEYETFSFNPPIHIYINRINNRLVFKTKDGHKLEFKHLKRCNYLVVKKK